MVFTAVFGVTLLVAAGEPVRQKGEAEVTADKLNVDHKNRTADFEGHVRAVFDKLSMTCHKMSLSYDEAGDVKSLKASGNVTVVRDDVRATAQSVRLDSTTGRLILQGSPSLVKGPHRLTGQIIEVDLESGRLEVKEARGTFRLKKASK